MIKGPRGHLSTKVKEEFQKVFKEVKMLGIDEISMVAAEQLYQSDQRCRLAKQNFRQAFG